MVKLNKTVKLYVCRDTLKRLNYVDYSTNRCFAKAIVSFCSARELKKTKTALLFMTIHLLLKLIISSNLAILKSMLL